MLKISYTDRQTNKLITDEPNEHYICQVRILRYFSHKARKDGNNLKKILFSEVPAEKDLTSLTDAVPKRMVLVTAAGMAEDRKKQRGFIGCLQNHSQLSS